MKYLVTGHTGFKGSWLTAILKLQGHEVHGIALNPEEKSLFNQANISKYLTSDIRLDIREGENLKKAFEKINPEVVIHLAAQPLVRASYADPIGTFETNVLGTLNVLEATKNLENLQATQIITTDKVYKNKNQSKGYVETDELGGDDPYSSSKAAADLATQSWRFSFGTSPISIVRAGNVIGGGDWSTDRIVPDIVKAIESQGSLTIRNPAAIRPWQHVLDCLSGYLTLIEMQLKERVEGEWNFGPTKGQIKNVLELTNSFSEAWGEKLEINIQNSELKESNILLLDSQKSQSILKWNDQLDWNQTIQLTSIWYRSASNKKDCSQITESQILDYLNIN